MEDKHKDTLQALCATMNVPVPEGAEASTMIDALELGTFTRAAGGEEEARELLALLGALKPGLDQDL